VEKSFFADMRRLFREGAFSGGPYAESFERAFADYLGAPHCVGVNSGCSAVHLALLALGIGPGDEVIAPAFTFVGSAWGILYCGATPVFADVDPETACLDPESVEAACTERTRAVIAVHLFGRPADLAPLRAICRKRGLRLVEDAAQSHGALWREKATGTIGDVGCFSFYPSKNLGAAGEAGAVVTSSRALAEKIARLRNHAQRSRYRHEAVGFNYRMDGIQGLFLEKKLAHLGKMNRRRREIADAYLGNIRSERIALPPRSDSSVWHLFVVRAADRKRFLGHLDAAEIGYGIHYPVTLPELPPFRKYLKKPSDFAHSTDLSRTVVSLPLYYGMSDRQVEKVIGAVNSF
jgi:dTDP-4-amino-4,6-dideoxygalactose transaminase